MNFTRWTIRQRISFGFASITLIALAFGLYAVFGLSRISRDTLHITGENLPAISRAGVLVEQIQSIGDQNSVLFMKLLLSSDDDLRADFARQIGVNLDSIAHFSADYGLYVKEPAEKTLYAEFKAVQDNYHALFNQGITLAASNQLQTAMELKEGRLEPALQQMIASVRRLENYNRTQGESVGASIQAIVKRVNQGTLVGLVLVLLGAGCISFGIIRSTGKIIHRVVTAIAESSASIARAGSHVSATSQEVAQNSTHQTGLLVEAGKSFEELSSVVKTNAEHAHHADEIAQQTCLSTESGVQSMEELDRAVQDIKNASGDIAAIVKTIDEIAFQTNILALNASVEAARAGQAGLGFAVVADEVSRLAHRSAEAARETASRIQGAIVKTNRGAELSGRVKDLFTKIQSNARDSAGLDKKVAGASRNAVHDISQIQQIVCNLDRASQANAASSGQSAMVAGELHQLTGKLADSVTELQIFLSGQTPAHPPKTPAPPLPATTPPATPKAKSAPARRPPPQFPAHLRPNPRR